MSAEAGKRLLLIELNEFSEELFQRGVRELGLRNIERLLAMQRGETTTDDQREHHGLDPWVQWVGVHTGQASTAHGVLHLGDTPAQLSSPQLWEVLSARGVSSGIWGAMNATRGEAALCRFFLPDPWTFSEPAYPPQLNDLLALPRYYSRNYLDVSVLEFARGMLRLARYVLGSGAVLRLLGCLPMAIGGVLRNGLNNAVLFSLFDLFSAQLFRQRRRRDAPRFALVFLNSIAHLQHHRWRAGERLGPDLGFGLRVIDRVLGVLFDGLAPGEAVVVMNALTQKNVSAEGLVGYRQVNPGRFVEAVGLDALRVEALMTNDAHVFFRNAADRDRAVALLEPVQINGKALFQVEADAGDDCKLFYQVVFWDALPRDATVLIGGREIRFFDHFEVLGIRSGAHIPEGQVYSAGIELPRRAHNHELQQYFLGYFDESPQAQAAGVAVRDPAPVPG